MAELKLTYGLDSNERLVHVDDVPSGLACNCFCPSCGEKLEACKGKIRRHHFRHYSSEECQGAFESQIHLLSKAILEEQKAIMLPIYNGKYNSLPAQQQHFTEVNSEVVQNNLKPDCLCKYIDENGQEQVLWVEIFNTHKVDENKAQKIQELNIACVEIEVTHLFENSEVIDKDVLIDFILHQEEGRHWINNPHYDTWWEQEIERIRYADINSFLTIYSDDENKIDCFSKIIYQLFSTGYQLNQEAYSNLYLFLSKFQKVYETLNPGLQCKYISVLQLLICHFIQLNLYKCKSSSKEELFNTIIFNRDEILRYRKGFVNDILNHFSEKLDSNSSGREIDFAPSIALNLLLARNEALYDLAREIIQEEKQILRPRFEEYVTREPQIITFDRVEIVSIQDDKMGDYYDMPICVGVKCQGEIEHKLWIILKVEQHTTINKNYILSNYINCMEIDLTDLVQNDFTKESVRERLMNTYSDRRWINYPMLRKKNNNARAKRLKEIQEEQAAEAELKSKIEQSTERRIDQSEPAVAPEDVYRPLSDKEFFDLWDEFNKKWEKI